MKMLILTAWALTCLVAGPIAAAAENPTGKPPAHEHHAPHGGTLVEFGTELAHVELVLDNKQGALKAYALDGEAENPVRLKQHVIPIRIILDSIKGSGSTQRYDLNLSAVANPLTGETEGDTSEFRSRSNYLVGISDFDAVILKISIRGGEFTNVGFRFPKGNDPYVK